LLLLLLLLLCSLYIMCFRTKVRLDGVSRISIVLFCLCGMESIYFQPCNIILSRRNDNPKGYLGSCSSLNVCQCGTSVQNISSTYDVQNMWWLIRDDRILAHRCIWSLSYLQCTTTGIFWNKVHMSYECYIIQNLCILIFIR